MTVEKLERVMWRLRSRNKNKSEVSIAELRRAIMLEIGTDPRTYRVNKKSLVQLQWITSQGKKLVRLTGKDLVDG